MIRKGEIRKYPFPACPWGIDYGIQMRPFTVKQYPDVPETKKEGQEERKPGVKPISYIRGSHQQFVFNFRCKNSYSRTNSGSHFARHTKPPPPIMRRKTRLGSIYLAAHFIILSISKNNFPLRCAGLICPGKRVFILYS